MHWRRHIDRSGKSLVSGGIPGRICAASAGGRLAWHPGVAQARRGGSGSKRAAEGVVRVNRRRLGGTAMLWPWPANYRSVDGPSRSTGRGPGSNPGGRGVGRHGPCCDDRHRGRRGFGVRCRFARATGRLGGSCRRRGHGRWNRPGAHVRRQRCAERRVRGRLDDMLAPIPRSPRLQSAGMQTSPIVLRIGAEAVTLEPGDRLALAGRSGAGKTRCSKHLSVCGGLRPVLSPSAASLWSAWRPPIPVCCFLWRRKMRA